MGRITRRYGRGLKSTSLETSHLVYDPVDGDWYAAWVLTEERDRRRARALIPPQLEALKRLLASSRSS